MKLFIGIGTTDMQMAPTRVLEKSLQKYAGDLELVIRSIHEESECEEIAALSALSRGTVFSLQRFLVAKIGARHGCDFALYIDSDIVCLKPFKGMLEQFSASDKMLCIAAPNPRFHQPLQSAVMLTRTDQKTRDFFTERLGDYVNHHHSYSRLLGELCNNQVAFKVEHVFNSRDFAEAQTVFLHYTDVWTQPWVTPFRKEGRVWLEKHSEMLASDAAYRAVVADGIAKRYYRPGIAQAGVRIHPKDLIFLPPQIKVYAERYHLGRVPGWMLGLAAQLIALVRSRLNMRAT